MKIAICSDIHDNIWALERALNLVVDADVMLFCGDLCAPFTLVQLAEGFGGPVHVVWGNNDGDKYLLTQQAGRFDHVELHGELASLSLGGLQVAVNHYPEIGQQLAAAQTHDLVCYGHDHRAHHQRVGTVDLVNPGEVMGRFGRSTVAVYDVGSRTVEHREAPTA